MKMIFKKERIIADDVYILELTDNHFFINKNGHSVLILDRDINEINSIKINQSVGIYSTLYSDDTNKILLYCPDNELLVYCDIFNNKAIPININILKDSCISPVYQWDDNSILLSTYDKRFYCLDSTTHQLKEVSSSIVLEDCPDLYNFFQIVESHGFGYQINSQQKTFIYKDETHKKIIFYDYKQNIKTSVKDPETEYHDIVYLNGYFIFITEENLTIIKNKDIYHYPLPDQSYAFLRARFMIEENRIYIVTLTAKESDLTISKITKYELLN